MKKVFFFASIMIFLVGAPAFTASASIAPERAPITENKLTTDELNRLTSRVEEIREMDKTEMTAMEKSELRKELKSIKKDMRRDGGAIYIGTGTLLLLIILVILLV
jgi:hypothetical protein